MRVTAVILLLAPAGACSVPLDREILGLRAEIARLERSVPARAPLWISDFEPFIEDFTPQVPEHVYLHLLRGLQAMEPGEPEARSLGAFDLSACLEGPARFRGKFWRVSGMIGRLQAESTTGVHTGILLDARARPVCFHVIEKPDVLTIGEDRVETHALFVKVIEFTTPSGRRVLAPFFVGRALRRYL